MPITRHNDITITEADGYTIIKVPRQPAVPSIQIDDIRFDEFVGMLEDDRDDAGKTPVEVEESAHDIWRTTAD